VSGSVATIEANCAVHFSPCGFTISGLAPYHRLASVAIT